MFKIIPCTLADLNTLCALSASTFKAAFSNQNSKADMTAYLEAAYHPDKIKRELLCSESAFYFIYVENALAGYLKLNTGNAQTEYRTSDGLEIERIYISPAYQNLGLGQTLMDFSIQQAQNLGKSYLWLGVWEKNLAAQRFYKRNGFVPFDTHVFIVGGDVQMDHILRKDLDGK